MLPVISIDLVQNAKGQWIGCGGANSVRKFTQIFQVTLKATLTSKECLYVVFELITASVISLAPASYNEYQNIKQQLEVETVAGDNPGDPPRPFHSLPPQEQARMGKKRLAGRFS